MRRRRDPELNPDIDIVFFDAAGTLFSPAQPVHHTYYQVALEFGLTPRSKNTAVEDLAGGFSTAFAAMEPLEGRRLGPELEQGERSWWAEVVRRSFADVGTIEDFEGFFDSVYRHFGKAISWRLEPGCVSTLEDLKAGGFALGVISNFDSRLTAVLSGLGLSGFLDTVVYSSGVERAKPHRSIFSHALECSGRPGRTACHVGDRYRDDYQGARNAGLRALLYDPGGHHPECGTSRIRRLPELLDILL